MKTNIRKTLGLLSFAVAFTLAGACDAKELIAYIFTKRDVGYTNRLNVSVKSRSVDSAATKSLEDALGEDESVRYVDPVNYPASEIIEFTFRRAGESRTFRFVELIRAKTETELLATIQNELRLSLHKDKQFRRLGSLR